MSNIVLVLLFVSLWDIGFFGLTNFDAEAIEVQLWVFGIALLWAFFYDCCIVTNRRK